MLLLPVSCIASLPPEILALVFETAVGDHARCSLPVGLSAVCWRWRIVALSTPRIWNTIFISRPFHIVRAMHFLPRSQSLPFHLHLDTRSWGAKIEISDTLRFLEEDMHRCNSMTLHLTDGQLQKWNSTPFGLSRLQNADLRIHSYAPDELWGPPHSLDLFLESLPRVSYLRLSTSLPVAAASCLLHLRTLDVNCAWARTSPGGSAPSLFRQLEQYAPGIEELILRGYSGYNDFPLTALDVRRRSTLPCLKSLVLNFRDAFLLDGVIILAQTLLAPTLRQLLIRLPSADDDMYPRSGSLLWRALLVEFAAASVAHFLEDQEGLGTSSFPGLRGFFIAGDMGVQVDLCIGRRAPDVQPLLEDGHAKMDWFLDSERLDADVSGDIKDEVFDTRLRHRCSDFCLIPGHNSSPWA
ncbi:unnamed protein product [Mycena citricolor]|uniref:F-box domain-containing protein n=1 Tax=Mycena citricolor TaxID=2018698 RepID=A0AAD2HZN3_9AGAR|nr:unnamed protein product [Mycena citricolor]